MKKLAVLIALLLIATPVLALQQHGPNIEKIKYAGYKVLNCYTTANLNQVFALKTWCPRQASIVGEDITVELLGVQSLSTGVYAHFKVRTNGNAYEFWRAPFDSPAVAGQYIVSISSVASVNIDKTSVWGSASFNVVEN